MIKSLVIKLVKRYAIGELRDAIHARGEAVAKWAERIALWLAKARLVVAFLERLADRLKDGELDADELGRTETELGILAGEMGK